MQRTFHFLGLLVAISWSTTVAHASPEPGITLFHVAYDNATHIGYGPYTGLTNPNYQNLSLVWSHTNQSSPTSNHFHGIGAYSYTGGIGNPQPAFSINNRIPEYYQQDNGLSLLAGSGPFFGKLISGLGPAARPGDEIEQEYGDVMIAPIDNLFQYAGAPDPDGVEAFHPGHFLLNANGGAYKETVAGITVGLKLVDLSPGLTIYDQAGNTLMDTVGDSLTLGTGDSWSFDPVYAVDGSTAPGTAFEATFILEDLSGVPAYGDSAEFTFSFVTVPEPSTALLGMMGVLGLVVRRRR